MRPPWRLVVVLVLALVAGCAPPDRTGGAHPAPLYVLNVLDGTVSRLDPARDRVVGPPLPAGPASAAIVPAADGGLLALAFPTAARRGVTRVRRAGADWTAQPVPLGAPVRQALLAGEGGRAAVAYHLPDVAQAARCRLVLLDRDGGAAERTHAVCAAWQMVNGLALEAGPGGAVAYLAIRDLRAEPAGRLVAVGGRVVALDARSGATLAVAPVACEAGHLFLAPSPVEPGRRLYCLVAPAAAPGAEREGTALGGRRLLGLDPTTLAVESEHVLESWPRRLVVAPAGGHAYALDPEGTRVRHLDLATGVERPLATLPGEAFDLAVAGDRLYVPDPFGDHVWVLDRHGGRLLTRVPVGRHPMTITAGAAP
jgi:hypothetical protein